MDERKRAAFDWLTQINRVLFIEWAPIGDGVPDDEYESYTPPIASLLLRGASDDEIAAYLDRVETESMGFSGPFPPDRFKRVIAALRALGVPNP